MITNKQNIIKLANNINFQSKLFAIEFKNSNKENIRYYLWLRELELFLYDNFGLDDKFGNNLNFNNQELEQKLINIMVGINK